MSISPKTQQIRAYMQKEAEGGKTRHFFEKIYGKTHQPWDPIQASTTAEPFRKMGEKWDHPPPSPERWKNTHYTTITNLKG